jgi:hypothetical protein
LPYQKVVEGLRVLAPPSASGGVGGVTRHRRRCFVQRNGHRTFRSLALLRKSRTSDRGRQDQCLSHTRCPRTNLSSGHLSIKMLGSATALATANWREEYWDKQNKHYSLAGGIAFVLVEQHGSWKIAHQHVSAPASYSSGYRIKPCEHADTFYPPFSCRTLIPVGRLVLSPCGKVHG